MRAALASVKHRVRRHVLGADIHEKVSRVTLRHLARYQRADSLIVGRAVLDAACGSGYGAMVLRSAASYVGIDLDPRAIAAAQTEYPEFDFMVGSVFDLQVPAGSVGAVTSFETLEHIPAPERAVASFAEVLERGGLLLGSIPINHPDRIYHHRPYNAREALDIFTSDERLDVQSVHAQHDLDFLRVDTADDLTSVQGTLYVAMRRM